MVNMNRPLILNEHPTLKNYENLVNNPQFSDFKIACSDGVTINAHKCILMSFGNDGTEEAKPSQFFRSMIESQMNESQSGEMKVAGVNSATMLELMRFIYAGKVDELFKRTDKLLILAHKCDIVDLKKVCVQILELQLSEENVLKMLKVAYILDVVKLRENCFDFIKL